MKFKIILILLTSIVLLSSTLAHPYPENDEETADTSAASGSGKEYSIEAASETEEIQEPALMQQEVESSERKFLQDMELEMETETEVSVKTVRNISDNQLTQAFNSMEHDVQTPQSAEDYLNDSKVEQDEETELQLQEKRSRMGRLLPTTTTMTVAVVNSPTNIPDYIRHSKTSEDHQQNLSQEHLNLSLSDYTDDDSDPGVIDLRRQPPTVRPAANSNENEDIVPLAMRYYDDDQDDVGATATARHAAKNGDDDDNDDDEYHEEDENNKLNNEPVPMPQQQWLPEPQSRQASLPSYEPQQNSSEEYYDEDSLSKEEESSTASIATTTTTAAVIAAVTAPVTSSYSTGDHNLVVFAGYPASYQPTTTAPVAAARSNTSPPTIGEPPIASHNNGPAQPQFDPTLGPTTPPYPIMAAAAAAAAAAPVSGDKKGKQIPIVATTTNRSTQPPLSPSSATSAAAAAAGGTTSKSISTSTTTTDSSSSSSSIGGGSIIGNGSSRRHLLPHEQLRNYIEDAYIRMPLAVIVDPSAESLEKTKALWNEALRANLNIKIILVTLNESGKWRERATA